MNDPFEQYEDYDDYLGSDETYTVKKEVKKVDIKQSYPEEFRQKVFETCLENIANGDYDIDLESNEWKIKCEEFVCNIQNVNFFDRELGDLNEDQLIWILFEYESPDDFFLKKNTMLEFFSRRLSIELHKELIREQTVIACSK